MECSKEGCVRPAKIKGLCSTCYVNGWQKAKRQEERSVLPPCICEHCGKDYVPARRSTEKRPNRFCSRACKDKARVMTPVEREEMLRKYYLRVYSLTSDEVADMRSLGCGICGSMGGVGRWEGQLHIDHCHDTGEVRGALCHNCNVGLGQFQHDTELLEKAIAYLRR